MTECNGCGACCDPFVTVVAPIHLRDGTANRLIGFEEAEWMRRHLTPIRRKDGLAQVSTWMTGGGWSDIPKRNRDGRVIGFEVALMPSHFYRFDPVERRCTDYDNRPPVCRNYPWYDGAPEAGKAIPPTCSYRADVGLPVAEMPVEWRR